MIHGKQIASRSVNLRQKETLIFRQKRKHKRMITVSVETGIYMKVIVISGVIERTRGSITVGDDFDIWIGFFDSIIEHNIVSCKVVISFSIKDVQ